MRNASGYLNVEMSGSEKQSEQKHKHFLHKTRK